MGDESFAIASDALGLEGGPLPTIGEARFVTDTATICIVDPASLRHRLHDDPDWSSLPEDELREVNQGTALFIGLGADGAYDIVVAVPGSFRAEITAQLSCLSGRVFLGAAEEVTADGLEPDCTRGGLFVDLAPGTYSVAVARATHGTISVSLQPTTPGRNFFDKPLRLSG